MTTLITGAGLVGTSYALCALARGEKVVFLDPFPREDYLKTRLGDKNYDVEREDFYFLEVNPRVQVEHTVTELITGHNLVELGIRVAQGEALPMAQEDITWRGHAIQCRLNAEDPREFVPSPGRLWECHFPSGFGIRCDTHAHPGYEMPGCFDSLLAKLLVWGRDREDAVRRMKTALDETMITGVEHLIPLHRRIMDEEDFNNGDITIQYIDMHQELLG